MKKLLSALLVLMLIVTVIPVASAEDPSAVLQVFNVNEYVSLRKEPSTSSNRVAKVYKGELVYYIGTASDGFLKCNYQGKEGYILAKYLKNTPWSAWETLLPNQEVTNCTEYVSLREAASTASARLKKVPLGATVTACIDYGEFICCSYGGETGYILAKYLKDASHTEPKPDPKPDPDPVSGFSSFRFVTNYSAKVRTNTTNGTVYLRWGPGTNYPVMTFCRNGASLTVLAEGNGWYQVRVNNTGYTGFMSSNYISKVW